MHLDHNVSLKTLHTFGMEVKTRYFVEARTHSEVLTLLNYRHMIRMPILFLGGGSNLLFTGDFPGIVIRINSKGIVVRDEEEHYISVTAEAGEEWDGLVQHCIANGWAGLENLSLIPGTVGAAPIQNIGAYGAEVKDTIESVLVADIQTGKEKRFTREECRFGYRDCIFKQELRGKVIVLNVTFRLRKTGSSRDENTSLNLTYADLRNELSATGVAEPTVSDVRNVVCAIRRRKLPDPAVTGNAGSFFKNPVVGVEHLRQLLEQHPAMPHHLPTGGKEAKIPAAWLIEQCGWKGFRDGDAGVHPVQPLVLVNYGHATGRQVLDLAGRMVQSVTEKFGIRLEREVNVVE